jgi:3-keto-5-aminohexanoate cleavage enzyme
MSLSTGAASAHAFSRAAAVAPESPVILTCAVAGGIVTGNPHQPVTRADVIAEALDAARAGANVIHVHARSAAGEMTSSSEDYVAIEHAIREQADDVIVNFSTGGQLRASAEERSASLAAGPDMATLTCGSMNFGTGDDVLVSSAPLISALAAELERRGIAPEYECFDLGMAVTAARLTRASASASGMIHMLLGIAGGAPASAAAVSVFAELVPGGMPWAVTAITRHFPMMALTLALGGHVRTGLEDVVYVAPGEYARSNAQLVTRAVAMCDAVGRPVATPAQAREILGIGAGG